MAMKAEASHRKKSPARRKSAPARKTTPAFREVLTRSLQPEKTARRRGAERQQRISIRLSQQEERRLQSSAAKAGLTLSEYLRRCALVEAASTPASPPVQSAKRQAATLFDSVPAKTSVLGDWISLLRNRFLASPARIAERA